MASSGPPPRPPADAGGGLLGRMPAAAAASAARLAPPSSRLDTASRAGSDGGGDGAPAAPRPMTAHRGAGYSSGSGGGGAGAAGRPGTASWPGQPPAQPSPPPPPDPRALEAGVHDSLEAAVAAAAAGDVQLALERAQEATRRERRLARALADAGGDPAATTTTSTGTIISHGAVALALAEAYDAAGRHDEALRTYRRALTTAAGSGAGPAVYRLRVNAGNAHLRAGDVAGALKHYRMALDAVPIDQRAVRARIGANVGAALVAAGRYADAAAAYEAALDDAGAGLARWRHLRQPDDEDTDGSGSEDDDDDVYGKGEGATASPSTAPGASLPSLSPVALASAAHNLAVCRYALDDGPGMMAAFRALAGIRCGAHEGVGSGGGVDGLLPPSSEAGSAGDAGVGDSGAGFYAHATLSRYDALAGELAERAAAVDALVLRAARLLAPALGRFLPPLPAPPAQQQEPALGGGASTTTRRQPGGGGAYAVAPPAPQQPPPPLPQWAAGYEWVIRALAAGGRPGLAGELRVLLATVLMEVRGLLNAAAVAATLG